jgi:hypothetical protein
MIALTFPAIWAKLPLSQVHSYGKVSTRLRAPGVKRQAMHWPHVRPYMFEDSGVEPELLFFAGEEITPVGHR